MPNIYEMCQCPCLVEGLRDSYGKHDPKRKESFERDTHIGYGFIKRSIGDVWESCKTRDRATACRDTI